MAERHRAADEMAREQVREAGAMKSTHQGRSAPYPRIGAARRGLVKLWSEMEDDGDEYESPELASKGAVKPRTR